MPLIHRHFRWCCWTGLNCRPLPYQGSDLISNSRFHTCTYGRPHLAACHIVQLPTGCLATGRPLTCCRRDLIHVNDKLATVLRDILCVADHRANIEPSPLFHSRSGILPQEAGREHVAKPMLRDPTEKQCISLRLLTDHFRCLLSCPGLSRSKEPRNLSFRRIPDCRDRAPPGCPEGCLVLPAIGAAVAGLGFPTEGQDQRPFAIVQHAAPLEIVLQYRDSGRVQRCRHVLAVLSATESDLLTPLAEVQIT